MKHLQTVEFSATIEIIGINPFVYLPEDVLNTVFQQAGKNKGTIPVKMTIDGHEFPQTLVKYSGHWRLYLNAPMRKAACKELGDTAVFGIRFDPEERVIPMHPKFIKALDENQEAKQVVRKSPRIAQIGNCSLLVVSENRRKS